jgi:hypothetical protein
MIKNALAANLAPIINTTPERALALMEGYNAGNDEFFESYFNSLPTISFKRNNVVNATTNVTLFIESGRPVSGAFGTVMRNRKKPVVYKEIQPKAKTGLKKIFKEIIIETLLQSDPTYGKHICTLYKVYRKDEKVILMIEALEVTLADRMEKGGNDPEEEIFNGGKNINSILIRDLAIKILEIGQHFKILYKFDHLDLHFHNIMVSKKKADLFESIKLIDFGESRVSFDDITLAATGPASLRVPLVKGVIGSLGQWNQGLITEKLNELFQTLYKKEAPPLHEVIDLLKTTPITNTTKGGRKQKTRKNGKSLAKSISNYL